MSTPFWAKDFFFPIFFTKYCGWRCCYICWKTQNALMLWRVSRLRGAVGESVVLTTAVIARPVVLLSPKRCYWLHPRIRCFTTINSVGQFFEQQINEVRIQEVRSRRLLSESGFVFYNAMSSITVSCLQSRLSGLGSWTAVQKLPIWLSIESSRITTNSCISDV